MMMLLSKGKFLTALTQHSFSCYRMYVPSVCVPVRISTVASYMSKVMRHATTVKPTSISARYRASRSNLLRCFNLYGSDTVHHDFQTFHKSYMCMEVLP